MLYFYLMNSLTIDSIKNFLSRYRPRKIEPDSLVPSAVLLVLVSTASGPSFLLTKRTESVEHHKGQISFPGGAKDSRDINLLETALRETEEEIGLHRSAIEILGEIDELQVPSGFLITPFVGHVHHLPRLFPNHHEVAEVLLLPIDEFRDRSRRRSEVREIGGLQREVYFYDIGKEPVWGATAWMIARFLELVEH
jgi:8-oxo-dGTP pyrophosphatase MutT (NUDIX family)